MSSGGHDRPPHGDPRPDAAAASALLEAPAEGGGDMLRAGDRFFNWSYSLPLADAEPLNNYGFAPVGDEAAVAVSPWSASTSRSRALIRCVLKQLPRGGRAGQSGEQGCSPTTHDKGNSLGCHARFVHGA